ncbi:MAG: DsbA family protein [Spirochaetia bacterium]|nr:DsbA family protein [Spirochaetia bacterium]
MNKTLNIFTVLIVLFVSLINPVYPETMAKFRGGQIEESDVLQAGAIALYEFKMQEAGLKQQILLNLLKVKLISLEEKSSGKKWNQLIIDFIDKNYDSESSKHIKNYYNKYAKSDSIMESENESTDIDQQLKFEIENQYTLSLFKKYNVKLNFNRPEPPVVQINTDNKPYWGKSNAKVTIVEFSDFECPYCKKMQVDIQKIKMKYGDKIKWVFIDFPLEFHKNAMLAHIAAHCAAEQGNLKNNLKNSNEYYFNFQQLLFQNAPVFDKNNIINLAESLHYNKKTFQTCLNDDDDKIKNQVQDNTQYGKNLGISGTPTMFINGKYYPGLLELNELEEIIDGEL